MNQTEMLKVAYEIGFQRALLEAGFSKEAGAVGNFMAKVFPSFAKTGPKNVAGGAFKKWQKLQEGKPGKSTQQLMRGIARPKTPQVRAPSI